MLKSKLKYILLFSSIIMFILGCLIAANPFGTNIIVNYIIVVGLGVAGISRICKFASHDRTSSVWDLVIGILGIMACMLLLSNGTLVVEATAGYVLAVLAFIDGIGRFFALPEAEESGMPKSWLIISGVLEILLGICLICLPIFMQVAYTLFIGIFLVVCAIFVFVEGLMVSTKPVAKKKR